MVEWARFIQLFSLKSNTDRQGREDENPEEILSLQFAKELQEFDGIGFFVSRDGEAFEHIRTQFCWKLPTTILHEAVRNIVLGGFLQTYGVE